jgi:alpha-amylase
MDENGKCTNKYVCEHRWPQIIEMVNFRRIVNGTRLRNWADNGQSQIGEDFI